MSKFALAGIAALLGSAALCPLCESGAAAAPGTPIASTAQRSDTATVRLHISKMTCGSCPITARIALKRIPGVVAATVTLDDSLGVVRYEPRRVSPTEIAARLTAQTGFPARILADSAGAAAEQRS